MLRKQIIELSIKIFKFRFKKCIVCKLNHTIYPLINNVLSGSYTGLHNILLQRIVLKNL